MTNICTLLQKYAAEAPLNGMVIRIPVDTKVDIVDSGKRYPAEVRMTMWVPGEGWFYQCNYLSRKYIPPTKDFAVRYLIVYTISDMLRSCNDTI